MKNETTKRFNSNWLSALLCTLVASLSLLISFNSYALGQLMISPTRVVFEGNERSKQINLINNGAEAARYRISFVRRNMTSTGSIVEIDENEPGMYSDEMVRFSPRQVTLAPGQSQTVRLMLRKKSGTGNGEYRSHMMFEQLPDASTSDVTDLATDGSDKLTIKLIPIVGVTIPVIVRQGNLSAKISLSDFEIKQTNTVKAQSILSLKINREGDSSAYGDFRVYFTPKGGEPITVSKVNGVAVYTSTDSRNLEIPLQIPSTFSLSNGELQVIFLEQGKDEKSGLIAEARFSIP